MGEHAQVHNRIASVIKSRRPDSTREKLASEKRLVERGQIIRDIGNRVLGDYVDVKVWGMKKDSVERAGKDERALALREEPAITELSDFDIKVGGNLGLVVVGFGNAFENGAYGAGPTRDLRRATLAPRLITITSNIQLSDKKLVRGISANLDRNFNNPDSVGPGWGLKYLIDLDTYSLKGGNETVEAVFWLTNLSKEKTGIISRSINGDLIMTLTYGAVSGHSFLPPEVRHTSPFYGKLDSMLDADGVYAEAKRWMDESIVKLKGIVGKILPESLKPDVIEAVTVYNT